MRRVVQSFTAVVGDGDDILDADAELAVEIDARFDGKHHPRFERLVVPFDDVRWLVHLQAETVARPVDELLAVAGSLDDLPGRGVDLVCTDSRFDGVDAGL